MPGEAYFNLDLISGRGGHHAMRLFHKIPIISKRFFHKALYTSKKCEKNIENNIETAIF